MKILVLQGPNLNLIGVQSARKGKRITLDKINSSLRRLTRNREIELKVLQTHRIEKAISFLQRNRNQAQGILLAPMAWGRYELSLLETLNLVQLPVVQVLFDEEFGFGPTAGESIFTAHCSATVECAPESVFETGLTLLMDNLQQKALSDTSRTDN